MCESKRDQTGTAEGVELPNASPPNPYAIIKFDIGDFVVSHRKIKRLCDPGVNLFETFLYVTRWEYPRLSFFCLAVSLYISFSQPVYFVLLLLSYMTCVTSLFGIRAAGSQWTKHSIKRHAYKSVQQAAQSTEQIIKKQAVLQAQEDLKEYIEVLIQIQNAMDTFCWYLEAVYKLFKWGDYKMSGLFLGCLVTSILLIASVSVNLVIAMVITATFTINAGFKNVCRWTFTDCIQKAKTLLQVSGVKKNNWGRSIGLGLKMSKTDETDGKETGEEWYDAETEISESSSEAEDNDSSGKPRNRKTRILTMVSQLSDYRKRQKKMNSGNCASCNVSFSTILKKRQYCRHCGDSFCSRCCSQKVKRSVFGATAPAAFEETVLVCRSCYRFLVPEDQMDS